MSTIKRTRHALYDLKYHLVWVPKYRKLVLKAGMNLNIDTMEVKEDHVHLFLTAPPRYSPSQIVQMMKSISAKVVFRELPEVEEQLWGGELWSDGYFLSGLLGTRLPLK